MYPYGSIPVPFVPRRDTRGALAAHRYTYAPPRCITAGLFVCCQYLWIDPGDPVFDSVGLVGFKSSTKASLLASLLALFLSPTAFPFFSFILWMGIVGLGYSD